MSEGGMEMPMTLTRSFFAVILPGIVAIAPWALYSLQEIPGLADLYKAYIAPVQICAFSLVVVAGGVIEALGTYMEKMWDVRVGAGPEPSGSEDWLEKDWYDYLVKQFGDDEPVAYRYLSRKVTELYFELGLMVAAPIGMLGILLILKSHTSSIVLCLSLMLVPILVLVFWRFAKDTHEVLYDTRYRIVRRLPCNDDK